MPQWVQEQINTAEHLCKLCIRQAPRELDHFGRRIDFQQVVPEARHLSLVFALHPLLLITVGGSRWIANGQKARIASVPFANHPVHQPYIGFQPFGTREITRREGNGE
ncbi:hypothetical protein D3C72_1670470 [compost metagenome]